MNTQELRNTFLTVFGASGSYFFSPVGSNLIGGTQFHNGGTSSPAAITLGLPTGSSQTRG